MLDIKYGEHGEVVLSGRFDAAQIDKASVVFDSMTDSQVVDFKNLEYISSIGLGLLLKTQKRLRDSAGGGLTFVNVSHHINDLFRFSGFHQIFDIRPGSDPANKG